MSPTGPNHALQRTAPAVTARAADPRHFSTHRHALRQPPQSLSLGSFAQEAMRLALTEIAGSSP